MKTIQLLLLLQFTLSLVAFAAIGGWFVLPWLRRLPRQTALTILLLPELFRHVGVNLLVPQLVNPGLPIEFTRQTAIGDVIVVILAWIALISLRGGWRFSTMIVWFFNILGLADLISNLSKAVRLGAAQYLGAAWYGPAFIVPAMLIVHIFIFTLLMCGDHASQQGVSNDS